MKRISILFFLLLFLSCVNKYEPRILDKIDIQEFNIEETSIRAINVVNEQTVYFAGSNGFIGFTLDGGKTWTKKKVIYQDSITPNFRSIALNKERIFALSIGNPALLYKITKSDTTVVYKEIHKKVFYDSLQFFDDDEHGIAVGDPTEDCASIILTNNRGETWTKVPCDVLPSFDDGEAFFAASNTNIKTLGSSVWIASGGKKARILRSDNYGKTWRIYNTPILQGNGPQGIYSIDIHKFKNGIIIGGDYSKPKENSANKAITKDGGKTWSLVANGENPNYKSCVQYVPQTGGKEIFAVGKTGISYSNDGGVTWNDVSSDSYYSIQFVDKHTAWLSGNKKIGKLILD